MLAFLLWQKWQIANMPHPEPSTTSQIATPDSVSDSVPQVATDGKTRTANTTTSTEDASNTSGPSIHIKTDVLDLQIALKGGTVIHADLLSYPESKNSTQPLALLHLNNPGRFFLQSVLRGDNNILTEQETFSSEKQQYSLENGQDTLIVPLTWQKDGITIKKIFSFKRGVYDFTIEQSVQNDSQTAWHGDSYVQWIFGQPKPSSGLGQVATYTGGVISYDDDPYEKVKLGTKMDPVDTTHGWLAMIQHYFLGAIVPEQEQKKTFFSLTNNGDHYLGVVSAKRDVAVGSSTSFKSTIYIGPKIQQTLKNVAPNLDKTVDYGILFMIGQPMYYILSFIHSIVHNWGWAIVLMTLLIKLLFFTPSAWAYKSMAKMRRLGPEMQRIKERYGDDRQAASMAMMKLYKDEKVNPASGCLPMLLQIPFFLAFYWMLIESVELRHAPWFGWVQDLSAQDPYFILPIINAALMFLQQRLNPPPPDPMQAKVMMMMPLIFGFMFMWFPSGLVLYWTVSNAFGIVQQSVMNKRYGEKKTNHEGSDKRHHS